MRRPNGFAKEQLSEGVPRTQRMLIGMLEEGRIRREMSQDELSDLSGLSRPYVSQLLNGRRQGSFEAWDALLNIVHSDFNGLGAYGRKLGAKRIGRRQS